MAMESLPHESSPGSVERERTTCCIAGGGPAGVMLGFLLARKGVDVLVLEKHKDFFRDFRGDTIHPSTLELMHELGILEDFLQQPHQELQEVTAHFKDRVVHIADLTHLPTHCRFIAFMPQWDFLNFISGHARTLPGFHLRMEAEVTDLLMEEGRVVGVGAKTPGGRLEVTGDLVVGADGRASTVRKCAGLEVVDSGSPIDVLWFRLPRRAEDAAAAFGYVERKQFMVLINRDDYWQCAYIIHKDAFEEIQKRGLEAFREDIARCAKFLSDRTGELKSWEDIKLLSVKVDHLRKWYREGLLCIGDSAHAMSPVGGVGINLAIQDAVAAANLLAEKLRTRTVKEGDLKGVQTRRERPAWLTQRVQIFMHEHLLKRIFEEPEAIDPPMFMNITEKFPMARRMLGRMVGMGFRPEHLE
jgi:2-polyprenyl-6-methoxyphenol hydroxylase-like FAD-dependent oxidoreductase